MTAPAPEDRGYLIIDRRPGGPAYARKLEASLASLQSLGWRRDLEIDGIEVWLGPRSRLKAVQVHRRHILIGVWRGARALSSLIGESRTAAEIAGRAVDQGWGRYVLAWVDDASDALALLRDPSGALDCMWWRTDGLTFVTCEPPPALDPLWPDQVGIDWETLGAFLGDPAVIADRLAVRGLNALRPGQLTLTGDHPRSMEMWSPARFCASRRQWDDDPEALKAIVDRTTAILMSDHSRLIGELSGGLDSALVAAALAASGRSDGAEFVNYYGAWPEGDERSYAGEVADALGMRVTFAKKVADGVTAEQIMSLGRPIRPGLNGLDVAYDWDMADRIEAAGATAVLSGQGGDAVFQQAADPNIIVDRWRRLGPRALAPRTLTRMAQWTGTSAWSLAHRAVTSGADEPLPPAKAGQVRALANAQLFWGDSLRGRRAELLQPLLTQPVMEHCLSIPVDVLTQGVRDRALARQAYSARLPRQVAERRGKGDLTQHYAKVVRASLPVLRPFILEGELAGHRLIDVVEMDRNLQETALIRRPASNRLLIVAALEAWARNWQVRVQRRRRDITV